MAKGASKGVAGTPPAQKGPDVSKVTGESRIVGVSTQDVVGFARNAARDFGMKSDIEVSFVDNDPKKTHTAGWVGYNNQKDPDGAYRFEKKIYIHSAGINAWIDRVEKKSGVKFTTEERKNIAAQTIRHEMRHLWQGEAKDFHFKDGSYWYEGKKSRYKNLSKLDYFTYRRLPWEIDAWRNGGNPDAYMEKIIKSRLKL